MTVLGLAVVAAALSAACGPPEGMIPGSAGGAGAVGGVESESAEEVATTVVSAWRATAATR